MAKPSTKKRAPVPVAKAPVVASPAPPPPTETELKHYISEERAKRFKVADAEIAAVCKRHRVAIIGMPYISSEGKIEARATLRDLDGG